MRGSGRTTDQMKKAPRGAIYIWVNSNLGYPRALARVLGREDLKIESPGWLESDRWRGLDNLNVVLDHATKPSLRQWRGLDEIRMRTARDA